MIRYSYAATGPDGLPTTGVERAVSQEAAELVLFERDLRDIRITEKKSILRMELSPTRVKRVEIMHLSRQLGAFLRAGLPVTDAVHSLGSEARNPSVRRMMNDVEQGLRRGEKLSDCFDRHPAIFPEFYRGILRSAEVTGNLDTVLDQLARYLERDLEARRKVKSALTYPSMIAVLSLVTVVVLAGFVLPRFEAFFLSLDAELPLATRILLAITGFLTNWWWAVLAGIAAAAATGYGVVRTDGGRYARDRVLLASPILGSVLRYVLVERFCRTLSSMAAAGVALPEALRVATAGLRNVVFTRSLAQVRESMLEGEGLAGPLARTGVFPATAARMVRVGEDTGTLDTQLEVTAHYYEGELEYKLKQLTSVFEPAVIMVMGLIVGFVAVALVSAMYGIFNQVSI